MEQIIRAINDATAAFITNNGGTVRANGLAEPILIDEVGGAEQVRPAVVRSDGEVDSDILDDRYSVNLYHTLTGKSFSTTTKSGYGDTLAYIEESNLSMVVFGDRSTTEATALEESIVHTMQTLSFKQGPTSAYCVVQSVSYNRQQIFASEYSGVRFCLRPNVFLFRINYKIITARRSCN